MCLYTEGYSVASGVTYDLIWVPDASKTQLQGQIARSQRRRFSDLGDGWWLMETR